MRVDKQTKVNRRRGMSLVELIVSTGVFSAVVAGAIASTILFTKIAADHENRADFTQSMRTGMENLSLDVRNASRVTARDDSSFSLSFPDNSTVSYTYDKKTNAVTRSQNGLSRSVFNNVSEFDVLTSADSQTTGSTQNYDSNKITIEKLSFSAGSGSQGTTKISMTELNFSLRNR